MSAVRHLAAGVDPGIPLALSATRGERHYDGELVTELHGKVEITLDGDRMERVVSYDVPRGVIVRQRRDWRGRTLVGEDGAAAIEQLEGRIEVRWLPGKDPRA